MCKLGFYSLDTLSTECLACHFSCGTCFGSSENECLSCKDVNSILSNFVCTCKLGYYLDIIDTTLCSICHSSCLNCTGASSNNCISCISSQMIIESGSCICPNSSYFDNISKSCIICPEFCIKCTIDQQCQECLYKDLKIINGECKCQEKYYWNDTMKKCEKCHSDCKTCNNSLINNCLSCVNDSIISNQGRCSCDTGQYIKSSNPIECGACSGLCSSCEHNSNNCISCASSMMELINGTCSCPSSYFLTSQLECSKCNDTCLICSNSTLCTSCQPGSRLSEGTCTKCQENCEICTQRECTQCFEGYYLNSISKCDSCFKSCKTCLGPSYNQCLTCINSSHSIENPPDQCECQISQYQVSQNPLKCVNCSLNCYECDEKNCKICNQGFSLDKATCKQNYLDLKPKLLLNFSISLDFSEVLLEKLDKNQLKVSIASGKELNFQIISQNQSFYLLNVPKISTLDNNQEVFLSFQKIFSINYSILRPLEYSVLVKQQNSTLPKLVNQVKSVVLSAAVGAGISSAFINNNDPYIWVSINTIQVLSYTPLINVKFPRFLESFLSELRPLKIIDFNWISDRIYWCDTISIHQNFYHYGFTCKHFLNNSVEILLSFSGGLLVALILLLLKHLKIPKLSQFCASKLKSYKYSFFIRFWIQAYIELLIPSIISMNFVTST